MDDKPIEPRTPEPEAPEPVEPTLSDPTLSDPTLSDPTLSDPVVPETAGAVSVEPAAPEPPVAADEPAAPEGPTPPAEPTPAEKPAAPELPVAPPVEPVAAAAPVEPPAEAVAPEPAAVVSEAPPEAAEPLPPAHIPDHEKEYPRFRLMARIEHMTLLISFTILCITGLPQKFPYSYLTQWMMEVMGGIEMARLIHRWAAIVLILGTIYHLLTSAYRLFVKREDMRMLPDLKDGFDLRDTVAYNLGFIDEPPKMRKFNFGEKFEYWAVVWGTAVMILTGFVLWNPIAATQFLPGELIPTALEAHGWEAVLAAVSIVIWHLYNVLVKHRNTSMFTGVLSHKIMEEEHALELERLEEGGEPWNVVPPAVLSRRRKAFFAVASVVAVLALGLVVWMFTFEDTAIIVPPEATQDVFVPLATPEP